MPPTKIQQKDVDALLESALPPYYQAVGRIAAVWAMLEQRLDQLIWDLADVEQVLGACLTTQLNGPTPRLRVLRALLDARGWPDGILTEVNKLSHKIQPLQEERNRAVHDVALVNLYSKKVSRRRVAMANNRLIFDVVAHSKDDLQKTYEDSLALLHEFNSLQERIRAISPSPSDDKLQRLFFRQGHVDEGRLSLDGTRLKRQYQHRSSPE